MIPWEARARIGPDELVTPAGSGGMGDVWKARDARLGQVLAGGPYGPARLRASLRWPAFARRIGLAGA